MWWCQFIDQLKFETHPSSPMNFGTANSTVNLKNEGEERDGSECWEETHQPSDFNALILLDHDILLLSVSPENDNIFNTPKQMLKMKT